jgi:hypothetical protein
MYMVELVMPDLIESVQKSLQTDIENVFRHDAARFSELDWMYETDSKK